VKNIICIERTLFRFLGAPPRAAVGPTRPFRRFLHTLQPMNASTARPMNAITAAIVMAIVIQLSPSVTSRQE
jgi:hypothetical protein